VKFIEKGTLFIYCTPALNSISISIGQILFPQKTSGLRVLKGSPQVFVLPYRIYFNIKLMATD
jgi:hypothetical protein